MASANPSYFLKCAQIALFRGNTISDRGNQPGVVRRGSVMGLDAGTVLKRSVLCPHCKEDYYFTLRAIADHPELRCHGCRGSICLRDSIYETVLCEVRNTLQTIQSAQSAPSFISAHPRLAV
jgi:hypothetical protein